METFGQVIAHVAEQAGSQVVEIGPDRGLGSGVVVGPDRIVTNAHNLPGAEAMVRFADGRRTAATVVAHDPDGDLAVLAADTGGLTGVAWSGARLALGTPVVALANSRGIRATLGFVSAVDRTFRGPRGRRITGAVEHTAPMARGSSGGPLLDAEGGLVGLNTHRLGDGFYLARAADDDLRARIDGLARGEAPATPHLGLALAPDRAARRLRAAVGLPARDGVLVHAVEEDGPAGRAGLRRGDLIVAAGERALVHTDDLLDALAGHPAGEALRLAVLRGTDELAIEVRLERAR